MLRRALFILSMFLFSLPIAATAQAEERPIRVTLINPDKQHWFWQMTTNFMIAAANDLNIELEILDSQRDHLLAIQLAQEVVNRSVPPDYLLTGNEKGSAVKIIKIADQAGVKVFLFSNGFSSKKDRLLMGKPRQKYSNWVGQLIPDNYHAGYIMGKSLIKKAREQLPKESILELVAIAGMYNTHASSERIKGLHKAITEENQRVELNQVFPGNWNTSMAQEIAKKAIKRYPKTRLFWSVNDSTAIGVIQAIEQAGFKSGKDFFVSGCGWDPSIFPLISQGKVTSSVGGHFMDGAWALVMLHDYHHGIDFIDEKWTSNMYELNQINGQSLSQLINKENWSKIDFKQFSKHYTPLIDKYNFRLNSVLEKTLTAE